MISKPNRSINVSNNLIVSRLVCHNFDRDLCRFRYRTVHNLHQTLKSPQFATTIASRTPKNIGFNTLIVWIRLRLHDLPSDQSHSLIIFITLCCFSYDLLLQWASMGCLVQCLCELVELVLSSAIGDDLIIASSSAVFRSKHHWTLTTPCLVRKFMRSKISLSRWKITTEWFRLQKKEK